MSDRIGRGRSGRRAGDRAGSGGKGGNGGDGGDGGDGMRRLMGVDRVVHEPARFAMLTILAEAEEVEFRFIEHVTGLTRGNLSRHATKLEEVGYLVVKKAFRGRTPVTSYRITTAGRRALAAYRAHLKAALESGTAAP